MSLRLSRASLVVGFLTFGSTFTALGGCAQRSPVVHEPGVNSFPGVQVIRTPTGGFSMRILSGLVGSGPPHYIIDNVPILAEPSGGIDWFTPEDIVWIKVLKDPSETSVYGPLGANGVILIVTNQGKRLKK